MATWFLSFHIRYKAKDYYVSPFLRSVGVILTSQLLSHAQKVVDCYPCFCHRAAKIMARHFHNPET